MIMDRTYRKAMPEDEALKEIVRCAGSQFDPKLVELFVEIIQENKLLEPRAKVLQVEQERISKVETLN